jgi:23S rRNA pseudouridine1911/1915/1917 synthase
MSNEQYKPGEWLLYKSNQFIAFNKPSGIPVQSDLTGDISLQALAESYTKSKLHLVHRLDRPASGVVLFAKTPRALAALNEQFQQRQVVKTYLALTGAAPEPPGGELIHYLVKRGAGKAAGISETEVPNSKKAVLQYKLLGSTDRYHLLQIDLQTGRHHQIRAQLASMGCPIKGDVKYGFRRANADRSIHLHAWKIQFSHPVSLEKITLEAPLPDDPAWKGCLPILPS